MVTFSSTLSTIPLIVIPFTAAVISNHRVLTKIMNGMIADPKIKASIASPTKQTNKSVLPGSDLAPWAIYARRTQICIIQINIIINSLLKEELTKTEICACRV